MMNLRPFQIILLGIFALVAVTAIVFLGSYKATPIQQEVAYGDSVVIWGTFDSTAFDKMFRDITVKDKSFSVVRYVRIDIDSFDDDLINAIAEGHSPDMILLSSDKLVKYRTKLMAIPYSSIPLGDYRSTYVDGAEVFTLHDGVYAIPFAVDPLMLFWNRDMFASHGLAQVPTSWEELVAHVVPNLTRTDANRNILQSAVALGEYQNVVHAKDILALFMMQSDSKLVSENDHGYMVELNEPIEKGGRAPLEASLQFYTDFSSANSPVYSWNRAMKKDKNAFISGDLALYFGFGSEAEKIDKKNPNLNFDMSMVPQGGASNTLRTYGTFYGFAIPRGAENPSGALAAAYTLTNTKNADALTRLLNVAPVRRTLITDGASSRYRTAILKSALIARTWLDPDPVASDAILLKMVEDVVSNRQRVGAAVSDAINRLVLEY